jgi:branched-chain amino acid transport system permease protein
LGFYLVQFLIGLADASSLFLVASGLSLIFGVTRIVNFAHGSFYMVGAYSAYHLISFLPRGIFSFWAAVFSAAVIVGLLGILLETLLLRRLYKAPELFLLLVTFGIVLILQDLTRWLFGAEDLLGPRAPGLDGSIRILGHHIPQYDLALILIAPVVLGLIWLLLHRTRWGILVRAATEDREMAAVLGVNQSRLYTGIFFLGSFLAGLGGAIQLPKGGADLLMDMNIIAAAFVVVVVGGMGSILGAYLAAVIMGELTSFGILVVPESTLVMMFLAMAVVLIVRPHGLLGQADAQQSMPTHMSVSLLRPASKKLRLLGLILFVLVMLLPLVVGTFQLVLMTEIAIFALASMSLYFMMGPGGMPSFGHAAFFGGGAYAAALMVHYLQSPMELAILLAPFWVGLLAVIIGWFCVRLSGVYLAMLTLAFAQICWSIVYQWGNFTGGDDGILSIWPSAWAADKAIFYYLTMIICIGGILALRHLVFAPFGHTLRACRDSQRRTEAIGINVRAHQHFAFAIAGAFAGLGGGLYVFSKGSVFPDEMAIARSFDFLLMVLLGGIETLSGPIVGSAAFIWLHDKIARIDFWQLVLGIIFIALVVLFPQGIVGYFHRRFAPYFGMSAS